MKKNRLYILLATLLIIWLPLIAFAQINVSLPAIIGESGETAVLPITVGDLTDENVVSYEFTIGYDTNVVKITDFDKTGTLSDGLSIAENIGADQTFITIAAAGTQALTGSGVLGNLTVEYIANGQSSLSWTSFMFNEGDPVANTINGSVSVGAIEVIIEDIQADTGSVVIYPITVTDLTGKEVTSYEFTLNYDETIMNITSSDASGTLSEGMSIIPNSSVDGQFTVAAASATPITGAGVLLNLNVEIVGNGVCDIEFSNFMFNEGVPVSINNTADAFVGLIDVTLPTDYGTIGDTATLPILVSDLTGQEVMAYEFTISYDSAILNITGVDVAGTASEDMSVVSNVGTGTITVAGAGIENMTGTTLLNLEVEYLTEGSSALTWDSFTFNEGVPVPDKINGVITAIPNMTPSLFFSEYIEGSGQNKALEIYNATTETIDLADYTLKGTHNGDNDWEYCTYQFPTYDLAAGEVYVLATTDADDAIKAVADTLFAYNDNKIVYFNGDDARSIEKRYIYGTDTTWVLIDVIGFTDGDPGTNWPVAGDVGATSEYTLVRKAEVTMGNVDWAASAGTDEETSEWVVMPQNTFNFLGSHPHTDAVTFNTLPEKFVLHQNYPNPFNPTTNIQFDLPKAMDVKLVVYDITGHKVTTLVNSYMEAGYKNIVWNGTNDYGNKISSGIYIYRIIAGNNIETMKMSYIK